MPKLGCGLGGLDWLSVQPLIENYFVQEDVLILVYLGGSEIRQDGRLDGSPRSGHGRSRHHRRGTCI
jgi:hypothetical protein